MQEGGNALAPFSFVKFCIDYPGECLSTRGPTRVTLTGSRMAELGSVNRAVNAAIVPTSDRSALRLWHLNAHYGDCNAFAVEKRHELLQRGWPAAALALTVVKTSWGEGHLVVTVRTDKGDLILDSLRSNVVAWERTGYDFIMRQSASNPQYWVELGGGRASPVHADKGEEPFAQAEASAEASEPVAMQAVVPIAQPGMKRADASTVRDTRAASSYAARQAGARAVEALIADLAGWIDNNRAVSPAFGEAITLLDPFHAAAPSRPVRDVEAKAKLAGPMDPTADWFL
jgi:predicted transglutaminase-like cysteine proteinase